MPSVSSLEQAAAALSAATADGRTVRIGADLDAAGMDRVLEHESGDLTCTVEAGIRLSALAAALAPAGQRLSLDPPGDPTIGACLAANLSGPAAPPVRRSARPRARRHARARRRHDRQRRRQGRQERRGLRPRQARLRLARPARLHRPGQPPPPSRSRHGRDRRRRDRPTRQRSPPRCSPPSSSRARSTSSIPAGSRCSSRAAPLRSRPRWRRPATLVGGAEADGAVWARVTLASGRGARTDVVRAGRAAGVPRANPVRRRPPVGRHRVSPVCRRRLRRPSRCAAFRSVSASASTRPGCWHERQRPTCFAR